MRLMIFSPFSVRRGGLVFYIRLFYHDIFYLMTLTNDLMIYRTGLFYYEMNQFICVDTFRSSNQFLSHHLDFFPIP